MDSGARTYEQMTAQQRQASLVQVSSSQGKNAVKIQSLRSTKPTLEISNPGREPKHGQRRTLEEPATSCGEVTAGCDEITNADGLSVALAAEKAASWLLRVLRVLRVLDISCN